MHCLVSNHLLYIQLKEISLKNTNIIKFVNASIFLTPVLFYCFTVMLDGKEINETAKRFLMNWKASRDARRRQRKQIHYLEGGTSSNYISGSSNILSSIPSLPPIQGPPNPDGGYIINPGMNPVLLDGAVSGGPHSVVLPRGTKPLAAIMQARVPNSTLLNKKSTEDVSQSRYTTEITLF